MPRGAYILSEAAGGPPELLLIASGSEVTLALQAQARLAAEGVRARVVSMPSWELFEAQESGVQGESPARRKSRRAWPIEAGVRQGWDRYVGPGGDGIWQETFGLSAPYKDVFKRFGFTVENVVAQAKAVLARNR